MNCTDVKTTDQALRLLVPNDEYWNLRTKAWYATFNVMLVIFGVLYAVLVGGAILSLAQRRSLARFRKVRTFIAIDVALFILGVSRIMFLSLDPWGQNEYFVCRVCSIVSHFLSILAFPSLTASYTLLLITLWVSARMRLGSLMVQKLRILLPLCFLHYGIAIIIGVIANLPLPPNATVAILVSCEAIFALWGILLCTSFMIAGTRLVRTIKLSAHSSSIVCRDTPQLSRHDLITSSKEQAPESPVMRYRQRTKSRVRNHAQEKHQRAVTKIARITYFAASLAIIYSFLILINLLFVCLNLFDGCAGKIGTKTLSTERWLVIMLFQLIVEFLLAALLSYANTDYRPFFYFVKRLLYHSTTTGSAGAKRNQVSEISMQKNK